MRPVPALALAGLVLLALPARAQVQTASLQEFLGIGRPDPGMVGASFGVCLRNDAPGTALRARVQLFLVNGHVALSEWATAAPYGCATLRSTFAVTRMRIETEAGGSPWRALPGCSFTLDGPVPNHNVPLRATAQGGGVACTPP